MTTAMSWLRAAVIAIAGAALFISTVPQAAVAGQGHVLDRDDLEAWLDGFVPFALKSGDIAGADILVVKDGRILLEKGYGFSDLAKKTPMDPSRTMIRLGSTSKLFTWTAVMQLVQAGKIDLDRDVNTYLDFNIPEPFGKPVTMRDLMNHRAGFEEGLKGILAIDPHGLESTERYLKAHPRPMLFPPGAVPAYSNYGASLAGYIVERVSHEPFERYVEDHIFRPLGMTNSTFDQPPPPRFLQAMSKSYQTTSGNPEPYELVVTRPAGSITATAADMAPFMLAHLQGGQFNGVDILSSQTAALMHSPSNPPFRPGFDTMAHGFFYESRNGHLVIGHGGDTVFFHSELDLLPHEGVGIFYSFNSRGREDAVYLTRAALLDGFMDRYFPAPPRPELPVLVSAVHDARNIAGLYESSRRVEHGFFSFFYLLQQTSIVANSNGTISLPESFDRSKPTFQEVAPQIWRDTAGDRELALTYVNGTKTVVDSTDPITVFQATPLLRSSSLNLTVLFGSVAILAWTLVLWPLAPWLRLGDRATSGVSDAVRRVRTFLRLAVAFDALWILGWVWVISPALNTRLWVYNSDLDPVIVLLELTGFLIVAAALLGVWGAWRQLVSDTTWLSRCWTVAVAVALVGVAWLGYAGNLIGMNLNY